MHRILKRILLSVSIILLALCIYYGEEILYGLSQGKGQLKIIWNARPIEEVMADSTFPDSLKPRIQLIQEIRQFAFDSLGIDPSENYTTVYDQGGKPILWVVTASDPYRLKAKEWRFPILGTFTYKGFFKLEKAEAEQKVLTKEGFDTSIDEVSGWSTLGWFKDPILSSMLRRAPGNLANLIIHELTHGTLYVKDSVQFNENLASFIGDKGALKFLEMRYGKQSSEYTDYLKGRKFNKEFSTIVLKHADRMDSLYLKIAGKSASDKKSIKEAFLKEIREDLLNFLTINGYSENSRLKQEIMSLNNTFFLDYRRYREDLEQFEAEFQLKFGGDLKKYLNHLKSIYPSL